MSQSQLSTPPEGDLAQALQAHGLSLRGGFVPDAADPVPALPDGRAVAWLSLVGIVGSTFWPQFSRSPEYADGQPDPLDRWSLRIGHLLAERFGGLALFPFGGPPWHPFQQWAARAEALRASPLMLLIHPQFGLWHAYRFALALPGTEVVRASSLAPNLASIPAPSAARLSDICANCDGQPCLHACPVQAFSGQAFLVERCSAHVHDAKGQACMQQGCLARHACPVGAPHRYGPEQAAFHMAAFAARH